ncbi:MAG TPA: tetraacyldisaccharide 4'-kinase [Leeuwenhoekiella sp.]|nr:tetraacyldisaccharide 4'-kinase [Leeuwenhoekiella sp.]
MKNLRKILLPFSWGYKGIMALRNQAYEQGWFASHPFDFPLIGVGNLSMGGTGKSPMTEYLIRLVQDDYLPATLSRGYGRNTSGFLEVQSGSTAKQVGDEPLQFKQKFPEISVVVDEDRVHGINKIIKNNIPAEVIVLDDVFQHRKVRPGFLILLTSYDAPFYGDYLLPAGNLRESRQGAQRADIIVVTKCPSDLKKKVRENIAKKVDKYTNSPVFFSQITYDEQVRGAAHMHLNQFKNIPFTVVTGIANPQPFIDYLKGNGLTFPVERFPDHHNFTKKELAALDKIPAILTTEKDYMRLQTQLKSAKLYYLPIQFSFLENGIEFDKRILDFIRDCRATKEV